MKAEEVAKKQLKLPEGIPMPGDTIQIQEAGLSGAKQVDVTVTQITGLHVINGEPEPGDQREFQRIISYTTSKGMGRDLVLTHDHGCGLWWRVITRVGKRNEMKSVHVFIL